jgi:protein O-GlcNAc transferase
VTLFSAPFFFHANRKPAAEPSPGRGAGPALSAHSTKPPVPAGKEVHEEALLTQALARKPDHTPVLLSLAKLAAESGKPKDAERHLREILRHEPGNLEARLELGKALFELGDVNGAIQETGAILKSQPSHPDALYNLGAIYGNIGNNGLARDYWTRLINADPNSESGKRAQKMIAQVAKP